MWRSTHRTTIENIFSNMYFGHREDIDGDTLHGLVRNSRPFGFPLDIPIVMTAGLTDRTTLLDLADGIVETNLINLQPALDA